MMKYIFFSKTMYNEAPRLRHQLAQLLNDYGHPVIFYQNPKYLFSINKNSTDNRRVNNLLEIRQSHQIIHHQLRLFSPLKKINEYVECKSIRKISLDIDSSDIIINFNYDYFFLRSLFPNNRIITVINDDFVGQARFFQGKHVLKSLSKTLADSNMTLTVSYPLFSQAKKFSDDVQLFLPWAMESYVSPKNTIRDSVLLWSYLDYKIDIKLLDFILSAHPYYSFDIVGPASNKIKKLLEKLQTKHKNLNVLPPKKLNELRLAQYFCSILPYRTGIRHVEAVTAANKTFQLLSKGLPLITYGMPNFLEHEAIFKSNSYLDFSENINIANKKFYELQPSISKLIDENSASVRYNQITTIANK